MNIQSDKPKMIFKFVNGDKEFYSVGLTKKDKDGNYKKGYISCRFKKDVAIENQTKIQIKDAWIDFYIKDKITYPYIFINKFEIVNDTNEDPLPNVKTEYVENGILIKDEDLPF